MFARMSCSRCRLLLVATVYLALVVVVSSLPESSRGMQGDRKRLSQVDRQNIPRKLKGKKTSSTSKSSSPKSSKISKGKKDDDKPDEDDSIPPRAQEAEESDDAEDPGNNSCIFQFSDGSVASFAAGQSLDDVFQTKCGAAFLDGDDLSVLYTVDENGNSNPSQTDFSCTCNPFLERQIDCNFCAMRVGDHVRCIAHDDEIVFDHGEGSTTDCTCRVDAPNRPQVFCQTITPEPTANPVPQITPKPTPNPTRNPTPNPTRNPTHNPTHNPTRNPTQNPTRNPTRNPTQNPTPNPTPQPSSQPSAAPSTTPTSNPSESPTEVPSSSPTFSLPEPGQSIEQDDEQDDVQPGDAMDTDSPPDERVNPGKADQRPSALLDAVAANNLNVRISDDGRGCVVEFANGSGLALLLPGESFGRLLQTSDGGPCGSQIEYPFVCNPNLLPHGIDYPYCEPLGFSEQSITTSMADTITAKCGRVGDQIKFEDMEDGDTFQTCFCQYESIADGPVFDCVESSIPDVSQGTDGSSSGARSASSILLLAASGLLCLVH